MTNAKNIQQAAVGGRTPINAPIVLVESDPAWPSMFEQEARRIRGVLGDRVLRLEHVGSTSVPGLAAKPCIDILLVLADTAAETDYVPLLERAGYVLRIRESDWHEHRMFKGQHDPNLNLHCFSDGCVEIARMTGFRDRLRACDADRLLYERTKRELAAKTWTDVQNYADAKTSIVETILARIGDG